MTDTRRIGRNVNQESLEAGGGPGREDTGLAGEIAHWGDIAHAHEQGTSRAGRDAHSELGLRRNRSGQ